MHTSRSSINIIRLFLFISLPAVLLSADMFAALPAPAQNVKMVKVINGRLNVPTGGWGGMGLNLCTEDPADFRTRLQEIKAWGGIAVRPVWYTEYSSQNEYQYIPYNDADMDEAVRITRKKGCISWWTTTTG